MREVVRAAAAQVSPVYMNLEGTVDKAARVIEEAGKKGIELLVFSETFIPGYPYWRGILPISRWTDLMVEYQKNSLRIPSSDTDVICEAASDANLHVAMGCSEADMRAGSGTLYNTLLFIDNEGKIIGTHRKLMPTHAERMVWGMGDGRDLKVFKTSLGNLGGLVCYEHHMTLLKPIMALKGEEVHCAVWPGWWSMQKHPGAKRRYTAEATSACDIEPSVRAYAFETQTFVISCSAYVPEKELLDECRDFDVASGGSFIVNPAGLLLAGPVFEREELVQAELRDYERRATKAYFDTVGHYSRWDLIQLTARDEPWEPRLGLESSEFSEADLQELSEKYGIPTEKIREVIEDLRRSSVRRGRSPA